METKVLPQPKEGVMRMNAPNLTTLGPNPSTFFDGSDKTLAMKTVPLHLAEEVMIPTH